MIKDFKSHWYRYFLGSLLGTIIILLVFCFYTNKVLLSKDEGINCNKCSKKCSKNCLHYLNISRDSLTNLISIFKKETKNITELDEKIASLNSRINDFYIFAGIVITLLLAINVSVYIKTSNEVEKHMKDNYDIYKIEIEKQLSDAKQLVALIKGEHELAKDMNAGGTMNPPPQV